MDWDSHLFKTKGSFQLDLTSAGRRWRTSPGQAGVGAAGRRGWREVDLHVCHFLREPGEKSVPTLELSEGAAEASCDLVESNFSVP